MLNTAPIAAAAPLPGLMSAQVQTPPQGDGGPPFAQALDQAAAHQRAASADAEADSGAQAEAAADGTVAAVPGHARPKPTTTAGSARHGAMRNAVGRDLLAPPTEASHKTSAPSGGGRRQTLCRTTAHGPRSSPARRCSIWPRGCRACPCRAHRHRTALRVGHAAGRCGRARRQDAGAVRRCLGTACSIGPRRDLGDRRRTLEARHDAPDCGPGHAARPRPDRRGPTRRRRQRHPGGAGPPGPPGRRRRRAAVRRRGAAPGPRTAAPARRP